MKKFTTHLLLMLAMLMPAWAYAQNYAGWVKSSAKMISDTEGIVTFVMTPESGWHVYSDHMPDDPYAPDPLAVDFYPNPEIKLEGKLTPSTPAPVKYDKQQDMEIGYWEKPVTFTQKFKFRTGQTKTTIKGKFKFSACNDVMCAPPQEIPFEIAVEAPAKAKDAPATPTETAAANDKKAEAEPAKTEATQPEAVQSEENPDISAEELAEIEAERQKLLAMEADEAAAQAEGERKSAEISKDKLWAPVKFADDQSTASTPWWSILIWGFIGGLAALLTPCVWPMIPMTMSFFLKRAKSRSQSIRDAVTYGLSIIVIFLVLGILITVIFGAGKLNELATSAVFNIIFFLILVVFAISFFGAFDIKLPASWSNKIDSKAESTTGLISIFFMAFTLVLVSFSCTGPIIGTLLVEAASQGNLLGPALGMGAFALGLALPFGLFAFFPQLLQGMPKSGGWLNSVKVVLGFLELILSLKFLSVADLAYHWGILDREVFISIWIVLFVLMGMYLLGKLRFSHDSPSTHTGVFPFFLAIASFSFAVYMLPGLWGAPVKAISAFAPPTYTQDFNLYVSELHPIHNYEEGMKQAAEEGKPVFLDFSGYACVNCRKMEGSVFEDKDIKKLINDEFVFIELMVDDKAKIDKPYTLTLPDGSQKYIDEVGKQWAALQEYKFKSQGQPYYVILNPDGTALTGTSRAYDEDIDAFRSWLEKGLDEYKQTK